MVTTRPMFTCQQCGTEFWRPSKGRDKREYCSRQCAGVGKRRQKEPKYQACETCQSVIYGRARRYCGTKCQPTTYRRKRSDCQQCGALLPPRSSRYCGVVCLRLGTKKDRKAKGRTEKDRKHRRVAKGRRRARLRSIPYQSIDPLDVLVRDQWTCQICGVPTPLGLRGTHHQDAPEVDHIIPLCLGGGHTWDNVRCACRRCNGSKGGAMPSSPTTAGRGPCDLYD